MDPKEALHNQSQTQKSPSQAGKTGMSESAASYAQAEPLAPPGQSVNPFAPDDGRYVTLEEYWAKWYENPYPDIDVSYEWNNGRLEAKPLPNEPQLDLYNWFLQLLLRYLSTRNIAKLINLETGFVLTIEDPTEPSGQREAVRKPDIGVILNSNPVPWGGVDRRHFDGVCDMVVESVSDSTPAEVFRDTEEKRRDYSLAGVKEYYILDPSGEHMRFYRLITGGRYEEIQSDAEGVIGSDVLPGLQFRMKDLERQTDLEKLALNDVYSGYVMPGYQVAVKRAAAQAAALEAAEQQAAADATARQTAEQRTEEEAQRADAEATARQAAEQRAEKEAADRRAAEQRAEKEAADRRAAEQRTEEEAQRANTEAAARQAAEQRAREEAAARRESDERIRAMADELARLRRQSS